MRKDFLAYAASSIMPNPIYHAERYFQTMLRIMNDRISGLWHGQNKPYNVTQVCAMHREIDVLVDTLAKIVDETQLTLQRKERNYSSDKISIIHIVNSCSFALDCTLPSMRARLLVVLSHAVRLSIDEIVSQYHASNPAEFLQQRKGWSLKKTAANTVSNHCDIAAAAGGGALTIDSSYGMAQALITRVVKPFSDIVLGVFSSSTTTTVSFDRSSSFTAIELLSVSINEAVDSFLCCILTANFAFDEEGVYRLYRAVLKFQEHVQDVKKEMGIKDPKQHIIQDYRVWQKAEVILQELNNAVFSETVVDPKQRKFLVKESPFLSVEQQMQWAQLVSFGSGTNGGEYQSSSSSSSLSGGCTRRKRILIPLSGKLCGCSRARKSHVGTVFVALTINLDNL